MPVFEGFCGPSNTQASLTSSAERTINRYVRLVDAGTPKARANLYRRPGLSLFVYLGGGPITATFAQDGRAFAVSGTVFYEMFPGGTATARGSVRQSPIASTISSSGAQGHQLFITAGGLGYIFDLNSSVFTQITDAAFPTYCTQGLFFDSSFIALNGVTGEFVVSDLYDGESWNGLNVGLVSQFSDQIIAMLRSHDNLLLIGTRNTSPWSNTGTGGAAGYVPVPGTIIEHGTGAPFSALELDNTAWWLSQDDAGARMVWRIDGYTPKRMSTHAVEADLARVSGSQFYNSVAMSYQEQGHTFYGLYVPGLDTSWYYDLSTDQWHERAYWDTRYGQWFPHVAIHHCFSWGMHLVGDRQSGAIYEQSMSFKDDALVVAA